MSLIVAVVLFAAWAYWLYAGKARSRGGAAALLMSIVAAFAAFDGTTLAMREYARTRDGVVTTGIVTGKFSSTGAGGTPTIRAFPYRRSWRASATGFTIHDELARLVFTGSLNAWIIDYRYGCSRAYGCSGRDFVPEALWRRLSVDRTVNVRRARGDRYSSRLDENPQLRLALFDVAFASSLFLGAAAVSGRLPAPRRPRYVTVPAVVVGVQPVKYGPAIRWRVRFAYFDVNGIAQESADEVVKDVWKPGDECTAVFPHDQPALASFRPVGHA